MIKLNHEVLHETLPVVSRLNSTNWNQKNGDYFIEGFKPCCIGAHLAHYFQIESSYKYYDYYDGEKEFYKRFNIDNRIVTQLLFICGTSASPFGGELYSSSPKNIWKRMMMIEGIINKEKLNDIHKELFKKRMNAPYDSFPNIIVDKPELFDGVLEFNHLHPKFKDLPSQFSDLHLELNKVKNKELTLV